MHAHLELTFQPMWPNVRLIRQQVGTALEATPGEVRIRVANGSTNAHGVAELGRRVEEVQGATDKQALYLARLEQLLAEADESGKLGIYRIGFEGGFDLACDYTNEVVTMTATRKTDV